jgi:hypothetical protein
LGIAALEDKIVQDAVGTVLNQIWEEDFLGISYGFRPGRSQHDALDALYVGITQRKVNWVLDYTARHSAARSGTDSRFPTRVLRIEATAHNVTELDCGRSLEKFPRIKPKHGSWLNQAEIEIGLFTRQCLGKRRIPDLTTLRRESRAWNRRMNRDQVKINWRFDRTAARRKFGYQYKTSKRSKT